MVVLSLWIQIISSFRNRNFKGMNENILKYKVQKKKLNSNNAKDVAFQDMVILSNEVKFLEVSESVRGTNENILKHRGADWQHFQQNQQ